ncbi:MAG TPA: TonB-dependent receptor [Saprospiraceae bacterium]|nr:TonB-dependent receptor [Saprospiraceae bacterium]
MSLILRLASLYVLLIIGSSLPAQNREAGIFGKITDKTSGLPISDALVRIREKEGSHALSDEQGRFRLAAVPAGKYTLEIRALGYEFFSLEIQVDGPQHLDFQLQPGTIELHEVVVESSEAGALPRSFSALDKLLRPVNSAQDLLQLIPGLFIAQHAGGGKAEQIFLRGFDSDHGTDFYIAVDGMPVNMVSHAHGQGYADFHFVIPETIDRLSVYKGPYTTRFGDFSTSGTGEFMTRNGLDRSLVKAEAGMFNTARLVGLFDLLPGTAPNKEQHAYAAAEYVYTDSYFDKRQKFHRYNLFAKYHGRISDRTFLQLSGSAFSAEWNGSGQIPERAVLSGQISRYGQIDSFEGGNTSRKNLNAILSTSMPRNGLMKHQLFYTDYDFSLFSNFTFYLNDPLYGDEIHQTDHRSILGYLGSYQHHSSFWGRNLLSQFGLASRYDHTGVRLLHSRRREDLEPLVSGKVSQLNAGAYADFSFEIDRRWTLNAGTRLDLFSFAFKETGAAEGKKRLIGRLSPKLNLYYQADARSRFFIKSGLGFHSNDARSVVLGQTENSLPKALGYEAGTELKLGRKVLMQMALWALHSQSELVYVGDEGVVETNMPTRRMGLDLGLRVQPANKWFADADFNVNHGRLVGAPEGEDFIPLAPRVTSTGGLQYKQDRGFNASLRYRLMDSRPANESNSIRAKGYTILDASAMYVFKKMELGFTIENLLNREWNQAQFDTTSRLFDEGQAVSELHFTPGTPFFLKGVVVYRF